MILFPSVDQTTVQLFACKVPKGREVSIVLFNGTNIVVTPKSGTHQYISLILCSVKPILTTNLLQVRGVGVTDSA